MNIYLYIYLILLYTGTKISLLGRFGGLLKIPLDTAISKFWDKRAKPLPKEKPRAGIGKFFCCRCLSGVDLISINA